jgi:hypothetical protein
VPEQIHYINPTHNGIPFAIKPIRVWPHAYAPDNKHRLVPQIRLIRKYASALNGFDLSQAAVGDVIVVKEEVAAMLILEGWAEPVATDAPSTDRPAKH